jgi:Ino eighty subunit 1
MASPSSAAAVSEMEAPSSPVLPEGKSFLTQAASDDDDDDDERNGDASPEPVEKTGRGKSKSSQSKDQGSSQITGKIRHLKKEDGEPLWRKDIQFDFLKAIFDDEKKVFTNSYDPDTLGKQCFADLYIDTMSRSSKTSKVLRDKLLSDRDAAKGMAMVCLLVNIGRMNTTLNCKDVQSPFRPFVPSLPAVELRH